MSAADRIKPLADRVVVKALEEGEQMRGGLYIPDTAKEKPQEGEIVAVGPGKLSTTKASRIPMEVKLRATECCTGSTAAPRSRSTGIEYLILRESDILAIVNH